MRSPRRWRHAASGSPRTATATPRRATRCASSTPGPRRARRWPGVTPGWKYPATDGAVTDTTGVVRRVGSPAGQIALTMFAASSGGYTAPGPGGLVPFPAVPDEGDDTALNPSYNWAVTLTSRPGAGEVPGRGHVQRPHRADTQRFRRLGRPCAHHPSRGFRRLHHRVGRLVQVGLRAEVQPVHGPRQRDGACLRRPSAARGHRRRRRRRRRLATHHLPRPASRTPASGWARPTSRSGQVAPPRRRTCGVGVRHRRGGEHHGNPPGQQWMGHGVCVRYGAPDGVRRAGGGQPCGAQGWPWSRSPPTGGSASTAVWRWRWPSTSLSSAGTAPVPVRASNRCRRCACRDTRSGAIPAAGTVLEIPVVTTGRAPAGATAAALTLHHERCRDGVRRRSTRAPRSRQWSAR